MMRLILIRHGESIGNVDKVIYGRTDYPLTHRGQQQSEAVRQQLKHEKIEGVISSPLKRTQYLAQLIAQDYSLEVKCLEQISEMDYGLFEGLKPNEVERQYGEYYTQYLEHYETYIIPNGEGYFQFKARILAFLEVMKTKKGTFVIVTHSGVIREILVDLLNLKHEQVWHFQIEPACQIVINYENNYGILEELIVCKY